MTDLPPVVRFRGECPVCERTHVLLRPYLDHCEVRQRLTIPEDTMDDVQQEALTLFLIARFDSDETAVNRRDRNHDCGLLPCDCGARRDRNLRDIAAKRLIVEHHGGWHEHGGGVTYGPDSGADRPCPELYLLASVYADHPDYRSEWAVIEAS